MSRSLVTCLLLASSALATPILRRQDEPKDNATDFDEICNHSDVGTPDSARYVWDKTNAGYYLDSYLTVKLDGKVDGWVNDMYETQKRLEAIA